MQPQAIRVASTQKIAPRFYRSATISSASILNRYFSFIHFFIKMDLHSFSKFILSHLLPNRPVPTDDMSYTAIPASPASYLLIRIYSSIWSFPFTGCSGWEATACSSAGICCSGLEATACSFPGICCSGLEATACSFPGICCSGLEATA